MTDYSRSIEGASQPERLTLLSEVERRRVLYEWNDTRVEYPSGKCIHELFEEQVKKTPQATAVVFEDASLTYGELNGRANRLAHYLRGLGVKPDERVAICVERGLEMVVGLLGILKAGGAYVPLDPDYPAERLRYMLEDSGSVALLTQGHLRERFTGNSAALPIVDLVTGTQEWNSQLETNPENARIGLSSRNLAYVIYTSGSTGLPKGVMNGHGGVVNRLIWMQQAYKLDPLDSVLQKTSFSFDVSVWEFFWPLLVGARLVMARPEGHKDPAYLIETIQRNKITTVHFVPSMLQIFLEHIDIGGCVSLARVVCSGEALSTALARRFQEKLVGTTLHNLYGPTEAAVDVTAWTCPADGPTGCIPIGRPIANTQIYILNGNGEPVPEGVTGELYIGGAGVARGYMNRPELTAERFVPDPFVKEGGVRMYRTGDLGRWLAEGDIEFLGRNDDQVKIRGFRIELGEIEARLLEHAGVREAVVVAREEKGGEKRLVAYYTCAEEKTEEVGAEILRVHLYARLPEYMVPAAYVVMKSLPLTVNGKLDRKALPAPDTDAYAVREYEAPVGETETKLAGIWAEVLKVERVGRHDNFFKLGGNSLLVVEAVSRANAYLNIKLSIADLYTAPTVEAFSVRVAAGPFQDGALSNVEWGPRSVSIPLTHSQRRVWFMCKLDPSSTAYHSQAGITMRGLLDVQALEKGLNGLIQRHEIFRTTFEEVDGEPVQIVHPFQYRGLQIHILNDLPDERRGVELPDLVKRLGKGRFHLDRLPLIRWTLVRLSPEEHVLVHIEHHLIHDGYSFNILLSELTKLYNYYANSCDILDLPIPKFQYADFAAWEQRWMETVSAEEELKYWVGRLAGHSSPLLLPFKTSAVRNYSSKGSLLRLNLSVTLSKKLRLFSKNIGTTLFVTMASAFAALLRRYTGERDIAFGTAFANRRHPNSEQVVGMFVNYVVLRCPLSENPTLDELLEHMGTTVLEAAEHQEYPFDKIVAALHPDRRLRINPLFQTMFSFHDSGFDGVKMKGLKVVAQEAVSAGGAKGDINVIVIPENKARRDIGDGSDPEGTVLLWEYNSDQFEEATIEQMIRHYIGILEAMIVDPSQLVDQLPLLSEEERRRVLYEWNDTRVEYPSSKCIHELFEEQAKRTPKATAVVFEDASLSYGELNRQANRLAHYLRGLGVKPDDRVAICVERGLEMVVGLLGILKAGGAHVPLDPGYPVERLRYMLEDSGPVVLLTQEHLRERFAGISAALPVLDLTDSAAWQDKSARNPGRSGIGLTSGNLAYVIYTSGSTGLPKGVMVEHRGWVNLATAQARSFEVEAESRILQFASFSFDASIFEISMALLRGASLYLLPRGQVVAGEALVQIVDRHEITHATLPPAVLATLPEKASLDSLRNMVLAGEALSDLLASRWAPGRRLTNAYGPTETTIWATSHNCEPGESGNPPIGRPIANAQIYILDGNGEAVPEGVAGELYIGGAGVARGYMNRAELTAERFVPDPFVKEVGERMYRTGDVGRWLAEGSIEFLGRNDGQVKIRGFRIELGEIEARLLEHAGVREAVVVAREDGAEGGGKRLVAYYTCGEEKTEEVGAEKLREHLAGRLPEYMVPAAYVQLKSLPLTANGKLDRRALPAPDTDAYAVREYEAPQSEMETRLAGIWAEVLKLERVGRHDNFFDLGGHSLLAVRMVSQVRQALGVEVSINDLFARPVLADFAHSLEGFAPSQLPAITRAERGGGLPLSFAQQRLWFLAQMEGGSEAYHIPFGLGLKGELDRGALRGALDRVVARHEALRTTFIMVDGEAEQLIHSVEERGFSLLEHDLRTSNDARSELKKLIEQETGNSFDLEAGPLIRGRLIRQGEDEHTLLITMHHIVSDGWSMGVLVRELSVLYGAFVRGEGDPLPELGLQYADYAVWQRKWIEGEILRQQGEYWKTALADVPAVLELPGDHARPAQRDYAGALVELVLDEELTTGLKELSKRHGTTLYMTMLAGWGALLGRLSGQEDVVLGTPVANRGRAEIEELIGFFVNTLALRLDLSGSGTVGELLGQAKKQALAAQQNQDIPFEQVVELTRPVRSLSHSPIFQVMLAWQNAPQGRFELPGLEVKPLESSSRVMAKFDLTLSLREAGNRIVGGLEYATALFERTTMERYVGYFRSLLRGMAADDAQVVDQLPLLSEEERRRVLYEWNETGVEYPGQQCIHELFEEEVKKRPEATAVVFEEASLTYGELNGRANRLAHYLRKLGVKPEERVATLLERSLELVVAELAVLKCGAAYVPIDLAYPWERKAFVMADSEAKVVLCVGGTEVGEMGGVRRVNVDEVMGEEGRSEDLEIGMGQESLAYIMYTSGSSGQPKGVMVPHRAIRRVVQNNGYLKFGASDRVAFASNPAFDATTMELWGALLNGGCAVVIEQTRLLDPERFGEELKRQGVSVLWLTVGLYNQYGDILGKELGGLRCLIIGGDAVDARVVGRTLEGGGPEHLLNGYGPTETTTFAAVYEIKGVREGARSVPIGGPITNTQIYVLDGNGEPVPEGVAGELYIGGAGVARGYMNRAELTAERFVPDPFAKEGGERMYRTGDVGRWLAEGSIEFLGRNDGQVKVRGFRIELGEIEARLLEYAGVREAVVVAREDGAEGGGKRLVAYYTCAEASGGQGGEEKTEEVGAEILREHLAGRLPEYMVPAAYVQLKSLPLTANGKLDRRALPAPGTDAYAVREYEAPVGETETKLAGIWAEVLKVERVGRHDNFFDLGGHSLLAIQLLNRIRLTLGVELSIQALFTAPSISCLGEVVEETLLDEVEQISEEEAHRLAVKENSMNADYVWLK